jgi:hypothetical protein
MQHFLNAKEGAVFGMEHDFKRFCLQQASLLRPESGIEGRSKSESRLVQYPPN